MFWSFEQCIMFYKMVHVASKNNFNPITYGAKVSCTALVSALALVQFCARGAESHVLWKHHLKTG